MFDPAITRHATPGVLSRWRASLDDIEADAVQSPHKTFFANRAFWSTLETAAVFLDDMAVTPFAASTWNALIAVIGSHAARNAGPSGDGPFKHFDNVKTFDDLYVEQFKYLRDLRGSDKVHADAGTGGEKVIPRTTNADVIALADYWSKQLARATHVMGHAGVAKTWQAATHDVDTIARKSAPSAVYAKNNAFWRALSSTSIQVAVADEAPSGWDHAKEALKDSVAHLPETIKHAAGGGVDFVASAAHAVGEVAHEAGKGLFQGFGTPLLVGAGLLGLFFVARKRRDSKDA
ncbi:MAG: hypothetical protein JO257_15190 [Deltaproteobacteria bacterium]|nr:hypothetical protein [Deltaproteobacteria bacterium]